MRAKGFLIPRARRRLKTIRSRILRRKRRLRGGSGVFEIELGLHVAIFFVCGEDRA